MRILLSMGRRYNLKVGLSSDSFSDFIKSLLATIDIKKITKKFSVGEKPNTPPTANAAMVKKPISTGLTSKDTLIPYMDWIRSVARTWKRKQNTTTVPSK